jgi:hypothetical protein
MRVPEYDGRDFSSFRSLYQFTDVGKGTRNGFLDKVDSIDHRRANLRSGHEGMALSGKQLLTKKWFLRQAQP